MPPRGRRPKAHRPTRIARLEKVRTRLLGLVEELKSHGFQEDLAIPGSVPLVDEPEHDPKTGGYIGKVKEPLSVYIQRVSISDNFSQRPPFDHLGDPIYKRLVHDYLRGALMRESDVAALSRRPDHKAVTLDDTVGIRFSIIDGLQRLYCYSLAILLVLDREKLVADGLMPSEAWDYFKSAVESLGDPESATADLLKRPMRYQVFYNIDLAGLLHYMVTFNTGQRRMSLAVQIEIMQTPLINSLEDQAQVPVFRDIHRLPGGRKPKDKFAASDLVLATQAFVTNNSQVTATNEAERFLTEDQRYLDNVGDINDVVTTLKLLAGEIHPKLALMYDGDKDKPYLLSGGGTFLIALLAACGYVRNRMGMKVLESVLENLMETMDSHPKDPLRLDEYFHATSLIKASRGKTTRRLVDDTFRRFFLGSTTQLEWMDTLRQITGSTP